MDSLDQDEFNVQWPIFGYVDFPIFALFSKTFEKPTIWDLRKIVGRVGFQRFFDKTGNNRKSIQPKIVAIER